MAEQFVSIFGLGGLNEIGKNMYCIQYQDEIIVIDVGLKFPDEDMLGIDLVIPDVTYLVENQHKIKAIFLTHGHEDHIGGLPYVLKQIKAPLYGAALTLGLVKAKLEEHGLLSDQELILINDDSIITFEHLSVAFFRTNHSIPDSFGLAVTTPQGVIVQTGDFKFDFTPFGKPSDMAKMAQIGKNGVLALLSDSTNSEKEGFTPSEKIVGDSIRELFLRCEGRILFATFASNVHRLQQVVEAAILCGRKLAVIGRSMEKVFVIGQELGYIRVPDGMIIDIRDVNKYAADKVVIICTGSQGEPNAALTRIAHGSHRLVEVHPGDTIIYSASPIPGNAINVYRSIDLLFRAGADVIHGSILDIHASGHGCQEDLKLMLNLMKPKYFIPIHGEHRMLVQHTRLAEQLGVKTQNIFILNIGNVLQVSEEKAQLGTNVASGNVFVEGRVVSKVDSEILEERGKLSKSGLLIVVTTINKNNNQILSGPNIVSRGFVYVRDSGELMRTAERLALRTIARMIEHKEGTIEDWKERLSTELSTFFFERTEREPMIMPIFMEVSP